jgi:hypothetical protein
LKKQTPQTSVKKRQQQIRQHFLERSSRAETLRILARAGEENPPVEGDELPPDWKKGRKVFDPQVRASAGGNQKTIAQKERFGAHIGSSGSRIASSF